MSSAFDATLFGAVFVTLFVIMDPLGSIPLFLGLTGLEVDHVYHDEDQRAHLRALAGELGLLTTGSSDYHGTNKTVQLASSTTDPEQYERLVARARSGTEVLTA